MILDDIAASVVKRVKNSREQIPESILYGMAVNSGINNEFPFKNAIAKKGLSFICEVKKGSPSKGIISENFPYLSIAEGYENAGADAVSVLTEPDFFGGINQHLTEISKHIKAPLLRKDFIIDEYQIYEAKAIGASAILLICGILTSSQLKYFYNSAKSLGLSVLAEAHNEKEIELALESGTEIIGVNNRDLNDFSVDLKTSERLRKYVPDDKLFVSESGMRTPEDIKRIRDCGADAVLIGEAFMRCKNISELMNSFKCSSGR